MRLTSNGACFTPLYASLAACAQFHALCTRASTCPALLTGQARGLKRPGYLEKDVTKRVAVSEMETPKMM